MHYLSGLFTTILWCLICIMSSDYAEIDPLIWVFMSLAAHRWLPSSHWMRRRALCAQRTKNNMGCCFHWAGKNTAVESNVCWIKREVKSEVAKKKSVALWEFCYIAWSAFLKCWWCEDSVGLKVQRKCCCRSSSHLRHLPFSPLRQQWSEKT